MNTVPEYFCPRIFLYPNYTNFLIDSVEIKFRIIRVISGQKKNRRQKKWLKFRELRIMSFNIPQHLPDAGKSGIFQSVSMYEFINVCINRCYSVSKI
jgi:hypothetical protein